MLSVNISNIAITTTKGVYYRFIIHYFNKFKAIDPEECAGRSWLNIKNANPRN